MLTLGVWAIAVLLGVIAWQLLGIVDFLQQTYAQHAGNLFRAIGSVADNVGNTSMRIQDLQGNLDEHLTEVKVLLGGPDRSEEYE